MSEAKRMTPEEVNMCRGTRFLLPPPGAEVAGQLIAIIDAHEVTIAKHEAALAKLRGRIALYRGTHAVHGTEATKARLDTAEVILDDFTKAGT